MQETKEYFGDECLDCWSFISTKTGIDRQKAKEFMMKFLTAERSITELAKDYKLKATEISNMISSFNEWSGAEG